MVGVLTAVGGVLGVALAPIMVAVKYLTGWAVIPEPFWIAPKWRAVAVSASP
jgi:hypothetical protein